MPLQWNGNQILAKLRQAEKEGLLDTDADILEEADRRVRKDTTNLEMSIDILQPPTATGEGFTSQVGSEEAYAAIQELGPADGRKYGYTPYLRPALDIHGKNLAGNIKKHFGG
ncbi:MAG: hypothetical protein J0I20_35725 [Chloroflexi bacterium]|nr:hypothetical protein [Chloroflexota bacterium]OJV86954.1 MAG: hypothetical protein BGO39_28540 [Chloroflexi bacterium 54-19]